MLDLGEFDGKRFYPLRWWSTFARAVIPRNSVASRRSRTAAKRANGGSFAMITAPSRPVGLCRTDGQDGPGAFRLLSVGAERLHRPHLASCLSSRCGVSDVAMIQSFALTSSGGGLLSNCRRWWPTQRMTAFRPSSSGLLLSADFRPAHPPLKKSGSESGLVMTADVVKRIARLFSALNASIE